MHITGKVFLTVIILMGVLLSGWYAYSHQKKTKISVQKNTPNSQISVNPYDTNPLSIVFMQKQTYPGSDLQIEKMLSDGSNYHQYIVSYLSEGLTIYALLTVPIGSKPANGWPVIIFNHGYITPATYETYPTSGQYASYYPVFSENGYIVLKPDYRGNGNSQGKPEGAYYSSAYAIDELNAIASIKKYKDANADKIGLWGHSMGGNVTLRALVVDPKDIKAAVIWGGVVGTYEDLLNWHDPHYHPSAYELSLRNKYKSELLQKYKTPTENPAFWNSIDPTNFVQNVSAPIELHAGEDDEEVPVTFSQHLANKLQAHGKTVKFYTYPGDNHNISNNFQLAMQRSVAFFDRYLK